jgi:hypothetical protein
MMKAASLAVALSLAAAGPIHAKVACDRACAISGIDGIRSSTRSAASYVVEEELQGSH